MTVKEDIQKQVDEFRKEGHTDLVLLIGMNKLKEAVNIGTRFIAIERIKTYGGIPVIVNKENNDLCEVVLNEKVDCMA